MMWSSELYGKKVLNLCKCSLSETSGVVLLYSSGLFQYYNHEVVLPDFYFSLEEC